MNSNTKDWQIEKMRSIIEERWEEVLRVVEARDTHLKNLRRYLRTLHRNIDY